MYTEFYPSPLLAAAVKSPQRDSCGSLFDKRFAREMAQFCLTSDTAALDKELNCSGIDVHLLDSETLAEEASDLRLKDLDRAGVCLYRQMSSLIPDLVPEIKCLTLTPAGEELAWNLVYQIRQEMPMEDADVGKYYGPLLSRGSSFASLNKDAVDLKLRRSGSTTSSTTATYPRYKVREARKIEVIWT